MNIKYILSLLFIVTLAHGDTTKSYTLISQSGNAVLRDQSGNVIAQQPQMWGYNLTIDAAGNANLTDKSASGHGNVAFIYNILNPGGNKIYIDYKDGGNVFNTTLARAADGNWPVTVGFNQNVPWDQGGNYFRVTVTIPTPIPAPTVAGTTKKFKLESRDGFAVITDERGNPVGDRFPQFHNYDLYVQGDGTPYLQEAGVTAHGNVAWINYINNLFGLRLDIDYKDNDNKFQKTIQRDALGGWQEWINFDKGVPWYTSGSMQLSVFIPDIRLPATVQRSFAIKSQTGDAVVYDLATGERTIQKVPQHHHYNIVIGENGAIFFTQGGYEAANVATIDTILNPYGFEYSVYWLDTGLPVQFTTKAPTYAFNKPVPWDTHGGQVLKITVNKKNAAVAAQMCNGSVEACALPYNLVSNVETHNAASGIKMGYTIGVADDIVAFFAGHSILSINDQNRSIMQQLQDGVRTLQFRATNWMYNGVTDVYACHGLDPNDVPEKWRKLVTDALGGLYQRPNFQSCDVDPGRSPLVNIFETVKSFLDKNPREVVTIFMQTFGTVDANLLKSAAVKAGVTAMCYKHTGVDKPWPTLLELINKGTRLVIFADMDTSNIPYYNNLGEYKDESNYSFGDVAALQSYNIQAEPFNNEPAATLKNKIFRMPNSVTTGLAGDMNMAKQANEYNFLMTRVEAAKKRIGKYPNSISVDFYELPAFDALKVANDCNQKTFKELMTAPLPA